LHAAGPRVWVKGYTVAPSARMVGPGVKVSTLESRLSTTTCRLEATMTSLLCAMPFQAATCHGHSMRSTTCSVVDRLCDRPAAWPWWLSHAGGVADQQLGQCCGRLSPRNHADER
jgi:hypothetical protein